MSDHAQEMLVVFGTILLLAVVIAGGATCNAKLTTERMRACAAMCRSGIAEFKDYECRCREASR